MGDTGERIRRGLRAAFGQVSWQPPQWVSSSASFVHDHGAAAASAARANPRRAALIGAGALALVVAAVLLWRWYENRPRPVEVTFAVTAPPVTCYACDPPRPPNPLIVRFDAATAPLERAGHAVEPKQAGISISPQLAGQWTWDDDKVLRFQPASDWPIGQRFEVSLSRKDVRRRARAPARLSLRVRLAGVRREASRRRSSTRTRSSPRTRKRW